MRTLGRVERHLIGATKLLCFGRALGSGDLGITRALFADNVIANAQAGKLGKRIPLRMGWNSLEFRVKSEDGTEFLYIVSVTRG